MANKNKDIETLSERQKEVLRKGVTVQNMVAAGYSLSHSYHVNNRSAKSPLVRCKAEFEAAYAKECKRLGFGGKQCAFVLSGIAMNGTRDFDRIQAVKEHHRIVGGKDKEMFQTNINAGFFIVPERRGQGEWLENAETYKQPNLDEMESED